MKAFLLAGGWGSRLRPYTHDAPKCLVEIGGEPLLGLWLTLCARHGIRQLLVNVTRHGDALRRFLEARSPAMRDAIDVTLIEEDEPLGSAGTLLANRWFVQHDDSFFVLYADNLTTADLSRLAAFHDQHDGVLTIGLFRAPHPRQAGIAQLAASGAVTHFEEKPANPASNLANAGIYVARQPIFDDIPVREGVVDLGHDVLPRLVGRMYGAEIREELVDIGTPEGLAAARAAWPSMAGAGTRT